MIALDPGSLGHQSEVEGLADRPLRQVGRRLAASSAQCVKDMKGTPELLLERRHPAHAPARANFSGGNLLATSPGLVFPS